jgi:hypothetical protein
MTGSARACPATARTVPKEVAVIEPPPDQWTAQESVPDEAHVGRFSLGVEHTGQTPPELHRGRFSEGMEQMPESRRKRHIGRFSESTREDPRTAPQRHRGTFADGPLR